MIVNIFLLPILIIAILALFLCVYGIYDCIYTEYIAPIIRQKKGGVWYHTQYIDNKNIIRTQWVQDKKEKGKCFCILKTETYEKDN